MSYNTFVTVFVVVSVVSGLVGFFVVPRIYDYYR